MAHAAEVLRASGAAEVQVLSADVTRADELVRVASKVAAMGEAADLVVTSAGIVSAGLLEEVPPEEWRRLHEVNVMGLVGVLQHLLPPMRARAERAGTGAHILNIASAAGLVGFPGMSAYGATKAAVIGLSESLRSELAGLGIGVTAVCPGFVQTPIADKLELFGRMDHPKTRRMITKWFKSNGLTAEVVARRSLRAVQNNRAFVVVGRDAHAGFWTKRLAAPVLRRVLQRAARL